MYRGIAAIHAPHTLLDPLDREAALTYWLATDRNRQRCAMPPPPVVWSA
jgi:hypothetical protein